MRATLINYESINMNKSIAAAIVASTLSISSQAVLADGWELFPIVSDDYQYAPQLSLIGGSMEPGDGDSGAMSGLELSLNCPLLKAPEGIIRQQISYASYDENGLEIDSFELNPHYQIDVAPDVTFGFGPGFGYVSAQGTGMDDKAFTLQAGASLNYSIGQIVIGAEARYQFMVSDLEANNGSEVDLDNTRMMLKLGYRF